MKSSWILLLLYSSIGFAENVLLSVGEKKKFPLSSDRVVHIGNKKLVSLSSYKNQLRILAKQEGQTLLTMGSRSYKIFIFQAGLKNKVFLLDQIIQDSWGLNWDLSKNNIIQVSGTLHRMHDWVRLAQLAKSQNLSYEFIAQLGEDLKPSVVAFFHQLFQSSIPPEIKWSHLPLAYIPQDAPLSFYENQLIPFGLKIQQDEKWLEPSPFIEIELALLETNSSSSFFFGSNQKNQDPLLSFSSLFQFLNLLKTLGKGKTLHHSSVLTQSGKEIHIQNGGEIPFSEYNAQTEQYSTRWKSYGLNLTIQAQSDKKNNVELIIKGNISEPLAISTGNDPPPLKNQTIKTQIKVKNKEIVKIYHQKKEGRGSFSNGNLSFSLSSLKSLFHTRNRYELTQVFLIQAKVIKKSSSSRLDL